MMPRFSANLTFLFNEVPFLERFDEAAHAGFRAVEFAFPYEWPAREIADRVKANKLDVVPFDADAEQRARRRSTLIRNLKFACTEAAEQGVTVLLEALNPRDVPNYLYSRQAEVDAVREEVGAANLKLQLDFYHAQIVEGDLTDKLRRLLPRVGHVKIAGLPGRHEPNVGEINYAWIFKQLDELRYDGWVGCEYHPLTTTAAGLTWFYRLLDRNPTANQG